MIDDWKQSNYHGYVILSRVVPAEGDYSKWVAEISAQNEDLFRLRLVVTGTVARKWDVIEYIENEGFKRVHARLDFKEFEIGVLYEHNITSAGEEVSHPFSEPFGALFSSEPERLAFHLLLVLKMLRETSPAFLSTSQFDLDGLAYYLKVTEEDLFPVIDRLSQQNLISRIETPHPNRIGAFIPTDMGITSNGVIYLDQLEQILIDRRRESVMPDIEENALQIARALYEGQYFGTKRIVVRELKPLSHLPDEDFAVADTFLLQSRYCKGTMGEDDGFRSLSSDGVSFVKRKLSERFELSFQTEQLARYLAGQFHKGRSFVATGQIIQDLKWEQDYFFDIGQELIDDGLAEEKPRVDQIRLGGLALTSAGRRAVRRNFRRTEPIISQQIGDQYNMSNIGDRTVIAAGRGASAVQGLSGEEVTKLFQPIYEIITADKKIAPEKIKDVRETVELIEEEIQKGNKPNDKALNNFLKHLMKMAPDIFDVVTATIANPVSGITSAIRKIADKAREEANQITQ